MISKTQEIKDKILESWISPNDLVAYFEIIIKLIKKYWKKLKTEKFLNVIETWDSVTYYLLKILSNYKKDKINDIKNIIKEIKKSESYKSSFHVNMIETPTKYDIQEKLNLKFPQSNIETNKNIDLWIFIHGEWRYYKRNIDQDLEKILW